MQVQKNIVNGLLVVAAVIGMFLYIDHATESEDVMQNTRGENRSDYAQSKTFQDVRKVSPPILRPADDGKEEVVKPPESRSAQGVQQLTP